MNIKLASKTLELTEGSALAMESLRRKLSRKDLHDWYNADLGEGWSEHKFPCHCGLTRGCGICRTRWVKKARARILDWFESRKDNAKFLTLTSVYVARLSELVKLMDLAVELCSWHWPKNFVLVGEFIEKGELWYCNLHAIVSGKYVPQKQLSTEWLGLTGDSYVVDIRKVKPEEKRFAVAYITKYLTKPLENMANQRPERVVEVMRSLYHRRLLRAHGFKRAADDASRSKLTVGVGGAVADSSGQSFTCSEGIIPVTNPVYWVFLGYEEPFQMQEGVDRG